MLNLLGYLLELAWVSSFLYGVYCALRGWGLRLPQRTRHQGPIPTLADFRPEARQYFKRALQAWGAALGVILLVTLVF